MQAHPPSGETLKDGFGRALGYLRVSLTDRCNLKCRYCSMHAMPLRRKELLTFEEILLIIELFHKHFGFQKARLTGGEPLLRRGADTLIERIQERLPTLQLGLTTNGILLHRYLPALRGVHVNVSLDTLKRDTFYKLTGVDALPVVLANIERALADGIPVKINTVVMRSVNVDEVVSLVRWAGSLGVEIRFIELMPFGSEDFWQREFVPAHTILSRLRQKLTLRLHQCEPVASIYLTEEGHRVGFIAPVSSPFCQLCNRLRITADGHVVLCMFDRVRYPLKQFLKPRVQLSRLISYLNRIVRHKLPGIIGLKRMRRASIPMRILGG